MKIIYLFFYIYSYRIRILVVLVRRICVCSYYRYCIRFFSSYSTRSFFFSYFFFALSSSASILLYLLYNLRMHAHTPIKEKSNIVVCCPFSSDAYFYFSLNLRIGTHTFDIFYLTRIEGNNQQKKKKGKIVSFFL